MSPETCIETSSGLAIARFFGPSSPNTICATVDSTSPAPTATAVVVASDNPSGSSSGVNSALNTGAAMKPTASDVTVMPS